MGVKIITDSGSDLPQEVAAAFDVTVVPLQVLLQGKTYTDGVDLSADEFYRQMRESRELPRTSQPSPHAFEVAYESAAKEGDVVGIHISAALSGTYQNSYAVARSISPEIKVWDSRTGSGGLALLVLEAAEMARAGAGAAAIVERVSALRAVNCTIVALNTLENAVKGGRVSPVAGLASSLLGIKPIVHMTDEGTVTVMDKARGRKNSLERLLQLAEEYRIDASSRVAVCHGGVESDALAFAEQVRQRFGAREIITLPIGAAIGTYAAEGAILLSFFQQEVR